MIDDVINAAAAAAAADKEGWKWGREERNGRKERREERERGKEMEIPSLFGPCTATGRARSLQHMHIRPPRERKVGAGGRGGGGRPLWKAPHQPGTVLHTESDSGRGEQDEREGRGRVGDEGDCNEGHVLVGQMMYLSL